MIYYYSPSRYPVSMKLVSEMSVDHPDSLATVLVTDFMSTTDSVTDMLKTSLNKLNDFDIK